ncbi:MAG: PPC domain-containing protein [Verrucomicrobiota bacterium]
MRNIIWLAIVSVSLPAITVFAQKKPPQEIDYIYPAGGVRGTTFNAFIGGQKLAAINNFTVYLDDQSIGGMDSKDEKLLQAELNQIQEKTKRGEKFTAADRARMEVIKQKLAQFDRQTAKKKNNNINNKFVAVQLTLPANLAPGDHAIRVKTPNGYSAPFKFCVGLIPETTKQFWVTPPKKPKNGDVKLEPPYEATVKLPATINGQSAPAGHDRYHFRAQKGQHLIIAAAARDLIPYLADAVPGWFEAVLVIRDAQGKEVAKAERYRFRPDPVLHFEVPADGDYTVEIHDSLYRGREDFIYRLTIAELPFVTSVFPLGGRKGEKTPITLTGWNLAVKQVMLDNSAAATGISVVPGSYYNAVPFAVDDLPECFEREPNDSRDTAQAVTLPIIINGHIGKPAEQDVYQFEGRTGQKLVAEVSARRLDSPLDSLIRLTDQYGKQLAFNDDFEDKGAGLQTHHSDSYFTATLPEAGRYFIHITDTQSQGGPDYAYRLRISEPRPDFALRVVPSSIDLRVGRSAPVEVYALRRDGFTNAINLTLKNAPKGFSLSGGRIGENQDKAKVTLNAPLEPGSKPFNLVLEGYATVDGHPLEHKAIPAQDMMQAFFYRHLAPAKELSVMVSGNGRLSRKN